MLLLACNLEQEKMGRGREKGMEAMEDEGGRKGWRRWKRERGRTVQ